MTKQRKKAKGDAGGFDQAGIQEAADDLLLAILQATNEIERLHAAYFDAVAAMTEKYEAKVVHLREHLKDQDAGLKILMKHGKAVLFADTDVINLLHGSLIRELADKVKIPKAALAKCEALGFNEVIKIAKSLDREAVEKWPDAKLFLIGAERKQKEEFTYDLKKERPVDPESAPCRSTETQAAPHD